MKATKILFLSLSLAFLISSCGDDAPFEPSWDDLGANYLKTGVYCGKCIGVCIDTMVITPAKLFYKPTTFGSGNPQSELFEKPFSQAEFNILLALVDSKSFNALDENSCDRCFDGCDIWYDLNSGDFKNSIVLSASTPNSVVSKLTEKINQLKASFK